MVVKFFHRAKFHEYLTSGYGGEDEQVKYMFSVEKRASLTHFVRSLRSQSNKFHIRCELKDTFLQLPNHSIRNHIGRFHFLCLITKS